MLLYCNGSIWIVYYHWQRPAADEDSSEETKLTTPSAGGFTLMFKPSPLASVASNLSMCI